MALEYYDTRTGSIVQVRSAAAVKSTKSHRHVDASAEAITASRRPKRLLALHACQEKNTRQHTNSERGESQQVSKLIQRVYHSIST